MTLIKNEDFKFYIQIPNFISDNKCDELIKDISENKNEGSNVSENAARIALQRNPSGKLMLSLRGESGFPHTVASPIRHPSRQSKLTPQQL